MSWCQHLVIMTDNSSANSFLTSFCEELIVNQNALLILSIYFVFNLAILLAIDTFVAVKLACAPICQHSTLSSKTPSPAACISQND